MALKTGKKIGVWCMQFLCRYQDFAEHHVHHDPQVEHVGSACFDGAEGGQKAGVMCMRVPSVSASMKILWSTMTILTFKLSMAALKTTVGTAFLDGAEDRQKTSVLCMRFFCRCLSCHANGAMGFIKEVGPGYLSMALKTCIRKKQVCWRAVECS